MFASHMLLPLNNNTMRDGKGYANIGMLLTYKGWRHDGGWGSKQRCRRVVPGPGRAETRGVSGGGFRNPVHSVNSAGM